MLNNFCGAFAGPREQEPNGSLVLANGPLCFGFAYTGDPDGDPGQPGYPSSAEDYDTFYIDLTSKQQFTIDVTGYYADGRLVLYYEDFTPDNLLVTVLPQADGHYRIVYSGNRGAGKYVFYLFAPNGHPTGLEYTLKVTKP